MRIIPTRLHGIVDYVVGLFVLTLSFYFGLDNAARYSIAGVGVFIILYTALTDYELGVIRFFADPLSSHFGFLGGGRAGIAGNATRSTGHSAVGIVSDCCVRTHSGVTTKVRALGTADDLSDTKETS